MSLPREEYYNIIRDGLNEKQKEIKNRYANGEPSMVWLAEQFIQELLNIVFEGEFIFNNLNYIKNNYPAVDLGDTEKGEAWQITVTSDKSGIKKKIKETLKSFYRNNDNERYSELKKFLKIKFFFAGGFENGIKSEDIPNVVEIKEGVTVPIKESLCNVDDLWDFDKLINKIEKINDTTKLEKIKCIVQKIQKRPKQNKYEFNLDYIPRTISIDDKEKIDFTVDLFKDDRRHLMLFANAAEGKTTYLDYIASQLSTNPEVFCIRARFIKYARALDTMIEAECPHWKNYYNKQKLIIILDGLDEVNSDGSESEFKEIEEFLKCHPDIFVITSCRTNYSPIKLNGEQDENFLAYPCFLESITDEERYSFIERKLSEKANEFIAILKESSIENLVENPFFLTQLLQLYKDKSVIPESKSLFMTMILENRFEFEKNKTGKIKTCLNESQQKIEESIKLLALVMQLSGKNKVTNKQLQQVIPDKELRQLIQRLLLAPIDKESTEWRFEHNNFWEYYAAQCLIELEWNDIKQLIEISGTQKLRPRWLNALSFYVGMESEEIEEETYNEVVNWLHANNQEALVKFEVDKIPLEKRTEIVQSIFETKNKTGIRIGGEGYTVSDLAKFAEITKNDELVLFLLGKLKSSTYHEMLELDAIKIINYRKELGCIKDQIIDTYLLLYTNNYNSRISTHVLYGFEGWKIDDGRVLEELTSEEYNLIGYKNLATLFSFIIDAKFPLKTKYLIDALNALPNIDASMGYYYYYGLISSLNTKKEFKKYLENLVLLQNDKKLHRIWKSYGFWGNVFSAISEKAIELFKDDKECLKVYLGYVNHTGYYLSKYNHNIEQVNLLRPYLEKYADTEKLFKIYLLNGFRKEKWDWGMFSLSAMLYKPEYNEYIFDKVDSYSINKHHLKLLKDDLSQINKDLHEKYTKELNAQFDNLLEPKPDVWEEQEKEKNKLFFKCLLDRKLYKSIINDSFSHFENNIIKYDDLNKKEFYEINPLSAELDIALDFLRN